MLMNFNPLVKLLLFVPQGEDLSFFYFQFPSSPVHQRRNQKSWRIHISGKSMYSLYCSQIPTEFLRWMSIHYGSTYHNCHTELLCDLLGQHHCKDHSQLYSLCNTKRRHQIQFLRVRRHQGLSMKRGSFMGPPGFNCWTSVAPAFQSWLADEYSSCFISVTNLDLYVRWFESLCPPPTGRGHFGGGHIIFDADPIGVGVSVGVGATLSCLHEPEGGF